MAAPPRPRTPARGSGRGASAQARAAAVHAVHDLQWRARSGVETVGEARGSAARLPSLSGIPQVSLVWSHLLAWLTLPAIGAAGVADSARLNDPVYLLDTVPQGAYTSLAIIERKIERATECATPPSKRNGLFH